MIVSYIARDAKKTIHRPTSGITNIPLKSMLQLKPLWVAPHHEDLSWTKTKQSIQGLVKPPKGSSRPTANEAQSSKRYPDLHSSKAGAVGEWPFLAKETKSSMIDITSQTSAKNDHHRLTPSPEGKLDLGPEEEHIKGLATPYKWKVVAEKRKR